MKNLEKFTDRVLEHPKLVFSLTIGKTTKKLEIPHEKLNDVLTNFKTCTHLENTNATNMNATNNSIPYD